MEITREKHLELYRNLLTARRMDEKLTAEFLREPFGPYIHRGWGQEAMPVAAFMALRKDDYVKCHMRFGFCQFAKGVSLNVTVAGEMMKRISPTLAFEVRDFNLEYGLLGKNGVLAEDLPLYAGAALSAQIRKTDQVALVIFGDGSSNRGVVHETMDIAAVWKLPIIFVCLNNQYAMSTPQRQTFAVKKLSDRALGYGMPGYEVDGNDMVACYEAATKAVQAARQGKGPSFIVANTYRIYGHLEGDPQTYRPKGEVEEWRKLEPVARYKKTLMENGILTEQASKKFEDNIEAELNKAFDYSRSLPFPSVEELVAQTLD
ncbi:MAG: thiamine pyrophosphate-dependent dehydrogenase E1 component subunit alpha [Dehalococcoidales bacterium]|nr:thiamine pyrophosphate-dependent dehydrogenase E1 component subunit alpha [Dehalococcoidales bacterium]